MVKYVQSEVKFRYIVIVHYHTRCNAGLDAVCCNSRDGEVWYVWYAERALREGHNWLVYEGKIERLSCRNGQETRLCQ